MTQPEIPTDIAELVRSAEQSLPLPVADTSRVPRRGHRLRRRRRAGLAVVAVVAVVVVAAIALPVTLLQRNQSGPPDQSGQDPTPQASEEAGGTTSDAPMTTWVRRLIDSPTRGDHAADSEYVADLLRGEPQIFTKLPLSKVLFTGTVGEQQVALIARYSDTRQLGYWYVGPASLTAAQLVGPLDVGDVSQRLLQVFGLTPYTSYTPIGRLTGAYPHVEVSIAPAECRIAIAPWGSMTYIPEPTGSYLTRGADVAPALAERTKVTCDGVVRYEGPRVAEPAYGLGAYGGLDTASVSAAAVDAALVGVQGSVDRELVRKELEIEAGALNPVDTCRARYGERVDGHPRAVLTCPLGAGWWILTYATDEGSGDISMGFFKEDLGDPSRILTVVDKPGVDRTLATAPAGSSPDTILAIAPATAVKIQVRDGQGTLLRTVTLSHGGGRFPAVRGADLRLQALDAGGRVVASGTVLSNGDAFGSSWEARENW